MYRGTIAGVVAVLAAALTGCVAPPEQEPARRRPSVIDNDEEQRETANARDVLWSTVTTFCARDATCNADGSPCIDNVSDSIATFRAAGDGCDDAVRTYTTWVACVAPLPCDADLTETCGDLSPVLSSCFAASVPYFGTCLTALYDDGFCDCDCGVDDPDCADGARCEYCFVDGQQLNPHCEDV